jgi:hypothetical protein
VLVRKSGLKIEASAQSRRSAHDDAERESAALIAASCRKIMSLIRLSRLSAHVETEVWPRWLAFMAFQRNDTPDTPIIVINTDNVIKCEFWKRHDKRFCERKRERDSTGKEISGWKYFQTFG